MRLRSQSLRDKVDGLHEKGFSQREIAYRLNIGKSTVGDYLRGETYGGKGISAPEEGGISVEAKISTGAATIYSVVTTKHNHKDLFEKTHLVIPDTQCKPDIDMSYLRWAGEYIADKKPDVIIHLGDHADMPSLSSYDKGKKKAEGKRVGKDIEAAIEGMNCLLKPLHDLQQREIEEFGRVLYKPVLVMTLGNHEERIMRHVNANPELDGFLSYDNLRYEEAGWEVHDFLKPVTVDGVTYVHYMANPMSGKPYGGAAMNVLKNVGESFTQGHKQTLDVATRFLPSSGKQQWAIIAGAYYSHDEDYKGYQGNHHWRGLIMKHNVQEGSYNPMFISINYLESRYG